MNEIPPVITVQYPGENSMNGIITTIRNIVVDPFSIISLNSSTAWKFDIKNLINWSYSTGFQTNWREGDENPYIEISFLSRFVYPTHFTLIGFKDVHFATKFTLFGSRSKKDKKYEKIQDYTSGDFCGLIEGQNVCQNNNPYTFSVNNPDKHGYKYLKIETTESSQTGGLWFASRAFELFGSLLLKPNPCIPTCNKNIYLNFININTIIIFIL